MTLPKRSLRLSQPGEDGNPGAGGKGSSMNVGPSWDKGDPTLSEGDPSSSGGEPSSFGGPPTLIYGSLSKLSKTSSFSWKRDRLRGLGEAWSQGRLYGKLFSPQDRILEAPGLRPGARSGKEPLRVAWGPRRRDFIAGLYYILSFLGCCARWRGKIGGMME